MTLGGSDGTEGHEEVIYLGDLSIDQPSVTEGPPIGRTQARLAYLLFALLTFLLTALLIMLWFGHLTAATFGNVAAIVVTPVVGLLGAATGYYYGKAKQ